MHLKKLFSAALTTLILGLLFPHILVYANELTLSGHVLSGRAPISGAQILFYDEKGVLIGHTISNPDGSFSFSFTPVDVLFTTSPSIRIKPSISRTGPSSWRIDLLNQPRSVFYSVYSFLRQHSAITGPIGGGLIGALLTYLASLLRTKIDNRKKRNKFRNVYLEPLEMRLKKTFLEIKEKVNAGSIVHLVPQYAKATSELASKIQGLISKYDYPLFEYDRIALIRLYDYLENINYLSAFFSKPEFDHQGLLKSCFSGTLYAENELPELVKYVKSIGSLSDNPLACNRNKCDPPIQPNSPS